MGRESDEGKPREWRERLARHRASGLSVARFCAGERVSVNTFYYWSKRVGSAAAASHGRAAGKAASRVMRAALPWETSFRHLVQAPYPDLGAEGAAVSLTCAAGSGTGVAFGGALAQRVGTSYCLFSQTLCPAFFPVLFFSCPFSPGSELGGTELGSVTSNVNGLNLRRPMARLLRASKIHSLRAARYIWGRAMRCEMFF